MNADCEWRFDETLTVAMVLGEKVAAWTEQESRGGGEMSIIQTIVGPGLAMEDYDYQQNI